MVKLSDGKGKVELNLSNNKDIAIQSILGIRIKSFRSLKDQSLILGEHVTILSGRNGTMKTSLMGLLAHPFSSEAKDAFGNDLKTPLNQVFRLSPNFDKEDYFYDMRLRTPGGEIVSEPVSIYYVEDNTNRHRIVVSGSEKGDGNFLYNTSFLNLKRLFPLVDTKAAPLTDQTICLSPTEAADLKDFYENIFPSSNYDAFVPVHAKKVKSTFALSGNMARYDWHSISSGEDNLGAIFNRLVGFQRAFAKEKNVGNGILCIDEFESSLHPVAQLRLFEYLYRWSAKYKVQIVISTHSLHLIQEVYLRNSANLAAGRVVINFVSKSSASDDNFPILHNPNYELAYKELTLSSPQKIAAARKIRVFCEDEYAIHFARRIIKSRDVLTAVEFHSSLDPNGGKVGTSWPALRKLCVEYPLLLEGSLALFDADVGDSELAKIKNSDHYLVLPDPDRLAIERRIVVFIISLKNNDPFFPKFEREREAFLNDFKSAGIRSLTAAEVADANKVPIAQCKAWADSDKAAFKKYVTYYCDKSDLSKAFRATFIEKINRINEQHGLPKIA